MLTIMDRRRDGNCQGYARREFLRIGGLALGGVSLSHWLAARHMAASENVPWKDRSVVLLFLQGGPAHIELFDPKMSAPIEFRSTTGEVATKLPGVTLGGTFPRMGQLADKLAIVRSFASGNAGHTYESVSTGRNPLKAAMGSLYARVVGTNDRRTGIPTNTLVLPEAVQDGLKLGRNFETQALPSLTTPGDLGPSFAAFDPSGGGPLKHNMELKISPRRLDDRRYLLRYLDRMKRHADTSGLLDGADRFQQQAFEVITGGAADAFDLTKEDPRTVARYDTSGLFRLEEVTRWGDMRRASNLLGRQMLLARRLCEAGCGFVTVSDCGWDMHSNSNSPKNLGGMRYLGPQVDHAVSAFVEDVHQRGLQDKILLVVTGEMGRTPRINKNGGRDHYGGLTSLALAGGGLRMGQVVGQSDANASKPATTPYGPQHLLATIMNRLFDIGQLRVTRGIPRDVEQVITGGQPIAELI